MKMKSGVIMVTTFSFIVPKDKEMELDEPEFISLIEAGLEESSADSAFDCVGLFRYVDWFYDGSSSEYEQ